MFSSIELPSPSSMSVALNQWKKWHLLPHDPVNGQINCMSAVATFFICPSLSHLMWEASCRMSDPFLLGA